MITIRIETGNAAFTEMCGLATEIGRILRELATRYEQDGIMPEFIYDINGNKVCFISQVDD